MADAQHPADATGRHLAGQKRWPRAPLQLGGVRGAEVELGGSILLGLSAQQRIDAQNPLIVRQIVELVIGAQTNARLRIRWAPSGSDSATGIQPTTQWA